MMRVLEESFFVFCGILGQKIIYEPTFAILGEL